MIVAKRNQRAFQAGGAGLVQSYPENFPASNPAGTGAAEIDTLGYPGDVGCPAPPDSSDSVYNIEITFAHVADSIAIDFSSSGLHALSDESWGLDNVSIRTLSPVSAASYWEIYR